jgi:hypothetical protein
MVRVFTMLHFFRNLGPDENKIFHLFISFLVLHAYSATSKITRALFHDQRAPSAYGLKFGKKSAHSNVSIFPIIRIKNELFFCVLFSR